MTGGCLRAHHPECLPTSKQKADRRGVRPCDLDQGIVAKSVPHVIDSANAQSLGEAQGSNLVFHSCAA